MQDDSPSKYKIRLPESTIKSLLYDIENNGGRLQCALLTLCNHKQDIYGLAGSKQRRSIQNKFQQLKNLSEEAYKELLDSYGVQSNMATDKPPPKSAPATATAAGVPTSVGSSAPHTPPRYPITAPSPACSVASTATSVEFVGTIEVDIERPERNRETFVFQYEGKEKDGVLFSGLVVVVPIELPDCDLYAAKLTSPDLMEIKMPALPYSFNKGLSKTEKAHKKYGTHCDKLEEGRKAVKEAVDLSIARPVAGDRQSACNRVETSRHATNHGRRPMTFFCQVCSLLQIRMLTKTRSFAAPAPVFALECRPEIVLGIRMNTPSTGCQ
jgi:hypothetical protein